MLVCYLYDDQKRLDSRAYELSIGLLIELKAVEYEWWSPGGGLGALETRFYSLDRRSL